MHHTKLAIFLLSAIGLATAGPVYAATYATLATFNAMDGWAPEGNLTLSGSTLYGMTTDGGTSFNGNVFSLPVTGGTPTNLASFSHSTGTHPQGSLTLVGSTLYGMTNIGGTNNAGTIVGVPATGGTPTVLSNFNDSTTGGFPTGNLTLSANGSTFYGVTPNGGVGGVGTVFSVPVTGGTPTVLVSFNGLNGGAPEGSLILSPDGTTLYGAVTNGGTNNQGAVFSVPVTGGTPTILASFNGTDGLDPTGTLTLVGSTLYGTTEFGGPMYSPSGGVGDGTVFSVPITGGTPTDLGTFNGTNGDEPNAGLTLVGSKLYGMTELGGLGSGSGDGTIFSVPLTGGGITTVFDFTSATGGVPRGSLTASADGSILYGMTYSNGINDPDGSVFALSLVPEPSSVVLLALGAIGLAAAAGRNLRRRQSAVEFARPTSSTE